MGGLSTADESQVRVENESSSVNLKAFSHTCVGRPDKPLFIFSGYLDLDPYPIISDFQSLCKTIAGFTQ